MKVAVIGCGVMGGAIAKQVAQHHEVLLYDHKAENSGPLAKQIKARVCETPQQVADEAEVIILAIKPKDLKVVAAALGPSTTKAHFILSILSGIKLKALELLFPKAHMFRLMPNLPLLCGKGMIGVVEEGMDPSDKVKMADILQGLGEVTYLPEKLMDPFTALTGSNPAYIYVIIEAMVSAGVSFGFKSDMALEYVLQTIEGSVALLRSSQTSPEKLREQITSPGGTTIAGLNEMEAQRIRYGIVQTLKQTVVRAEEMGEEA